MSVESPLRSRTDQPLSLIETMRYEPSKGCVRQQRHLDRMANSSRHFGKAFDLIDATAKLDAISGGQTLRVRLYLDEQDQLTLSTHSFSPTLKEHFWTVAISQTKLQSTNTLLAHKTSLRKTYEAARGEFDPTVVDEVLLCNEHGHLCEGTITNLFVQKGQTLVTPPLTNGLLRGVLREELLDTSGATEASLVPSDLLEFPFFVGNSLRGLIPAKLLGAAF
jgi:4-amino-4-deoxychorismate lyase